MPVSESWLTDVAERVGEDWPRLAIALGLTEADVAHIGGTIDTGTQAHATINSWLCSGDRPATHAELQKALRLIGREDIMAQTPSATDTDNAPVRPIPSTTSRTSFDSCTCRRIISFFICSNMKRTTCNMRTTIYLIMFRMFLLGLS